MMDIEGNEELPEDAGVAKGLTPDFWATRVHS
jgi:hypothetical protein